jgi:hypothetical protein
MLLRTVPGPKDDKQRLALKRLQEVGVGVTCCPQQSWRKKKNFPPPTAIALVTTSAFVPVKPVVLVSK